MSLDPGSIVEPLGDKQGATALDGPHCTGKRVALPPLDVEMDRGHVPIVADRFVDRDDGNVLVGATRRISPVENEVAGTAQRLAVRIARSQHGITACDAQRHATQMDVLETIAPNGLRSAGVISPARLKRPDERATAPRTRKRRNEVAKKSAGVNDVTSAIRSSQQVDSRCLPDVAGQNHPDRQPVLGGTGHAVEPMLVASWQPCRLTMPPGSAHCSRIYTRRARHLR